ncbi:aminoacyl-histidine dipeptidase [Pseudobutyrivibrio xylanivorans]|uniref:Cytosol non-specific dipeptidase n=1 Tax=Pseudobutyrivibrio xylanivorans DSM 14809 TaxID=1123012 RepID=A0A1M6H854_PSEXY|nr:aminoacyl-histidine dipeptidase [Pseudobutyrivibrio xylanivorans]SHJ18263.1 dipeptidase D [Pseudobutyrivibrio xylanivorans DSM 14809]
MAVLSNCKPERVFHYFEEICIIPHPSYHEEKISAYLVNFAKEHNLEYYTDDLYNVIMIKEASKGMENVAPIILQGHMDMVAEQEPDCTKDMLTEGLDLEVVDGYVTAKGTTLGGDDGIAVAMALALLEDETLKHPRLEVIITVSEEVGMEGAAGIDVSMIKGRKLLNLDSEEEGHFLAGCAGGCRMELEYPAKKEQVKGNLVSVEINDCTGGHSGTEIDKGRANATLMVNRMLAVALEVSDVNLVDFVGGTKDNAIPRATSAKVIVSADAVKAMEAEAAAIKNEFAVTDPEMKIDIKSEGDAAVDGVNAADTKRMIQLLSCMPDGVQAMSHDIEGLVETSLNLGILKLTEEGLNFSCALRSSVDSAKAALMRKVSMVGNAFGCKISTHGEYPAWEYKRDSSFRDELVALYEEMTGDKALVETLHAGVECGLLASKLPGLDAVSIGPEMHDIHTPKERLGIASTERIYNYVRRVIETSK